MTGATYANGHDWGAAARDADAQHAIFAAQRQHRRDRAAAEALGAVRPQGYLRAAEIGEPGNKGAGAPDRHPAYRLPANHGYLVAPAGGDHGSGSRQRRFQAGRRLGSATQIAKWFDYGTKLVLIGLVALTAGKATYYAVQRATRPAPIVAAAPASMKVRALPQRPR